MSVPTFLRDRHAYWLKLPLCFGMQLLMALFADADELPLAGVWIPNGQSQIRSVREVLDVVDNRCFSISFLLVFASLALVPIQPENVLAFVLPGLPAVEQIRRSRVDQRLQPVKLLYQGYHLRAKQKAPKPRCSHSGKTWLRRWSLWTLARALRYSRDIPDGTACTCAARSA